MSKKKEIKELFKTHAKYASTHGLALIRNSSSRLGQMIWIVIVCVLISSMFYSVIITIRNYFQFKTMTNTIVEYRKKLPFPSITVCRNNLISRRLVPENFTKMVEEKIKEVHSNKNAIADIKDYIDNITHHLFAEIENTDIMIPEEPSMILKSYPSSCLFANSRQCNLTRDFKPTFPSGTFGRCYTFNPDTETRFHQLTSGPLFGLSMILYVNQSDYIPLAGNSDGAGFTIYIHSQKTLPLLGVDGIFVSPGRVTAISLKKTEIFRKPPPYPSKCSSGEGILNYLPGKYTSINCKVSCILKKINESCGYADPIMRDHFHHIRFPRATANMHRCKKKMETMLEKMAQGCHCPLSCYEEYYNPTSSSTVWPCDADMPFFKSVFVHTFQQDENNVTDDVIIKNFAKVDVSFRSLSVTILREEATLSIVDALSAVGGHLGFWSGSSVFSVVETLALIIGVISVVLHITTQNIATPVNLNEKLSRQEQDQSTVTHC